MIPQNITHSHILKAIDRARNEGYPIAEKSKDYDLLYKNYRYPPKVIIRYANKIANGTEKVKFPGGELTANPFLRKRGFIIVEKGKKPEDYFFNKDEVEYFLKHNNEIYNKNNSQHQVLLELLKLSIRPKTKKWAKEVTPSNYICEVSHSPLKRSYRDMVIRKYTWAKIFKKGDEDKQIYFTVGVHANDEEPNKQPGLVYKLDYQSTGGALSGDQVAKFDSKVDGTKAAWQSILLDEIDTYSWDKLIKKTKDFIYQNEKLYDEVIKYVWSNQKPLTKSKPTFEMGTFSLPTIRRKKLPGKGKTDWETINNEKSEDGLAGEEYIFNWEKENLIKAGKSNLAKQVEHTSKEKGDDFGYDIFSFTPAGEEKYIEVKTTKSKCNTRLYVTRNELFTSKELKDKYYLYRVYNFNKDTKIGEIKIRRGAISESEITPEIYTGIIK